MAMHHLSSLRKEGREPLLQTHQPAAIYMTRESLGRTTWLISMNRARPFGIEMDH